MRARHAIAGLLLLIATAAVGDDRYPTEPGGVSSCVAPLSCPGGSTITTSMSTNKLLGRATAGTGVVEEIGLGVGTALFGGDLVLDSSAVLLYSDQDVDGVHGGDFLPDFCNYADAATVIDTNDNGTPELTCNMATNICGFDVDESGANDFIIRIGSIEYDGGYFIAADGVGIGNLTQATESVSACFGRSATTSVDRLFEDKDCDYDTGQTEPETTPAGTTNSEAFLTEIQRRLSSTFTTNGTTDATGVQVTGLKLDLDWVGAYLIEYQILSQSAATGNGISYGVEYTGTETSLFCTRMFVSDGTTAATGVIDNVAATLTGQLVEGYAANAASTTAPNLGPNTGVVTANATALEHIQCNLLTTTAGDLTFHVASEANGTTVSVMANSFVVARPMP